MTIRTTWLGRSVAAALLTATLGVTAIGSPSASAATKLTPALAAAITSDVPPKGPVVTFAGKVPGTNAYLSLVSRGGQVEAYVCDGASISAWLKGRLDGRAATASNAAKDVQFVGKRNGTSLSGRLTLAGRSIDVTTAQVSWPAGLWKAVGLSKDNRPVLTGWVVLPDGTQRGAAKVGVAVTSVGGVDPTATEQSIGGGTTGVPVGSDPVPLNHKVTKKTPPPSVASQCASLQIKFDTMMDINQDPHLSDETHAAAGNQAHDAYLQGMALGCAWAPNPSGPATT